MDPLPADASDAALIRASLEQPDLFTRVFDRHFVEIHAFVQRRLGARLANRIATRTFVEAFNARAAFGDRNDDARPWLFGIAVKLVARHHRRERRRLRAYARRGPSLLGDATEVALERGSPRASSRELARAIARLDYESRDALLLTEWAGLDATGVAAALNCEIAVAGRLVADARRTVSASATTRTFPSHRPSTLERTG
jgi:RNA polymerase sigma-70 factor (ECF subfamily)